LYAGVRYELMNQKRMKEAQTRERYEGMSSPED